MLHQKHLIYLKHSSIFLLASCITLSLITITLLSGVILSSNSTSADAVDDVTINVPVSCNMASELDTAHTATINPGQFQSDIGTTNFKVVCNDNSGYAIYAIGYSNEEYGNTKMLATINNTLTPTYNINTGTNTSGANSSWSMKLIPVTTASSGTTQPYTPTIESDTNGSFANYHVVPETYTKVATFTSNTDFTIGSSLQSTYQVYIDGTKPAGTYTGKVKYTLVHPSDGAAPVTPPPAPSAFCNLPVPNLTYMQDLNVANKATVLATMIEDDARYYLRDKRDEKTYCVAKLRDGNIWMTQNLDLNLDSTKTYTPADTDIVADWTPSLSTYPTGNLTWEDYATFPESYDPGNKIWNGVPDLSWSTTVDNMVQGSDTHYHIGNYYNWTAAVALNDSSYATQYQDVNQSICPAGWTLPKSDNNSSGSFQYLVEQYGWEDDYGFMENPHSWSDPLYFTLGGVWGNDPGTVASYGEFWSPVLFQSQNYSSFVMFIDADGGVNPNDFSGFHGGFNVRCFAR